MDIKSLEINLFKASEINDGDILLVKMDTKEKASLTKEDVKSIYDQLTKIINKKDISIYFFPKNLELEMIKNQINMISDATNNTNEN